MLTIGNRMFGNIPIQYEKCFFFTQDDNQIALEAKELIDQYKASDATNKKLDDCPCVNATQCKRMAPLLAISKELSRGHPERKEVINYMRSQICDAKNQAVRCCRSTLELFHLACSVGDLDEVKFWKS